MERTICFQLYLDYDWRRIRDVEREVRQLKKLYPLGKAVIKLSSKRGRRRNYHVEFPDSKLKSQREVVEALRHTSCDPLFIKCAENLGLSVIRLSSSKRKPPIKFVKVIP